MTYSLAGVSAPSRRQLGAFALASLATAALGTTPATAATADLRSVSNAQRAADTQKLLDLINSYRASRGLGLLRHSATLAAVQEPEARRQFAQGYVSHGTAFLNDARVAGYSFAREVIALSYQDSLEQLLGFWKSSPAHNAAILAPGANAAGIGLAYGHGVGLPWRVLANVGIYRYETGRSPSDLTGQISGGRAAPSYEIRGGIATRYYGEGGAARFGEPLNAETVTANGGAYQRFSKNGDVTRFVWSPATGSHFFREASGIGSYWLNNGAERTLGFPDMEEVGGLSGGGAYMVFRHADGRTNKVIWSPITGTSHIYENGAIGNLWRREGSERGFGYPITAEYWAGVEVRQEFSSGTTLAWNSLNGAVEVR